MSFSEKVLELTKKIPKGKITTYKIIAEKLNTKAYRAVGTALHNNKKPIVIPCHRVVNSTGFIGGYGGGIRKKIKLLEKEGINIETKKIKNFEKVLFRF
ncbi:MAG: MGMT family protein [Candidatus Nanoarchaeia archaeon]|nr:MGMT family protein [Candidatus Nanoarchaeia archaeon]